MEVSNNKGGKSPHFDGMVIGTSFFEYFYKCLITNPDQLVVDRVIKEQSKLKYKSNVYVGEQFILFLKQLSSLGLVISNCTHEIFDSGSRQVQILVNGNIKIGMNEPQTFTQFLMIVYMGEKNEMGKWGLVNSILTIT